MNIRVTSITLALLLILNSIVLAETTTQFIRDGEEMSEVVLYLEEDVTDDGTKVEFPNAEVLDASYVVSGGADQDGNYAEDVSVTISGTTWEYSGEGYGPLGKQDEFSDGASKRSASFSNGDGGETSLKLLLPVNATITDAEVTLAGLPPAGELGDYQLTSENTNGGSYSTYPSVVIDGSDTFAVWQDDGNLENKDISNLYKILFNSRGSSWDNPTVLYNNDNNYVLSEPTIAGDSDYLAVSWLSSGNLQGMYSTDEGNSWSDVITYDSEYYIYYHDLEVEDEELYLTLSIYAPNDDGEYDYKIYFSKSDDDGATWTTPLEVSDSNTASRNMYPKMDVDGSDVHISWLGSPSGTDLSVYYSTSSNGGTSFSTGSQLSGTANTIDVDVTADGDNIVVSWIESGTATDETYVVKARASSNGGSSFNSEITVSSTDDADVNAVRSTNDGNNNFYISWTRTDNNDNLNIVVARSANSGTSWNSAVEIDGVGDAEQRGLGFIDADASKIVALWVDVYDGDGASSDPDIYCSYSSNDGSSWSDLEEIGSDQYYEADSFAPALAYSNDYVYAVYWDGGDNDPEGDTNGNDVMNDDGDIFFRRSADDGENWDDVVVISNSDTDGMTYDPPSYASYYYAYYRSDIAASGSNVYVVWSNYDYDNAQYEIRFSKSTNSGNTWSDVSIISSSASSADTINSYGPTITADGNNVYVAWQEYSYDGTTTAYNIISRYSSNRGDSWNSVTTVTDSDGTHYIPEIAYSNDVVHLTWHAYNTDGNAQYTIEYASSDDDGTSWERQVLRDPSSSAGWCWFPNIATEDDNVYVVWQDDDWDENAIYDMEVVLKKSNDNGGTWDEGTLIVPSRDTSTSFTYMLPAVTSAGGYVYVSYQDFNGATYDHYFKFSQDSGNGWSDEYTVTENHILNYAKMDLTIDEDGKTYFGYSDDTNIAEEEAEDNDIFIRATIDGYPTNPTINLDGGGDDWDWPGEFNPDNSPVTWKDSGENGASKSFAEAIEDGLQEAIDNEDTFVDEYGVEMANVTLTITSDTDGRVGFSELKIEYAVDFIVDQDLLVTRLNNLVEGTDDSETTAETKFSVSSSTNGKVILKDLKIVTAEADLEITQMDFSNSNPIEGGDLVITVHIRNTGEGDASADITYWYDGDNEIGSRTLTGIESGNTETISITWEDIPAGNYEITASIVDSVPQDKSQGDEDTISQSINIASADPEITAEFSFDGIAVEDSEIGWSLSIENEGDKYGNIKVYIYENEEDEDNLVYESPVTKIDVDVTKYFSGSWLAKSGVDEFYLKIVDTDDEEVLNGEGDGEYLDVSVQKMPKLTVSNIEWVDEDDNLIISFSEGTVAYAKIYILNEGSFDVTASVELKLTKSDKKIVPTPAYGANINFNGDTETILMINEEYPKAVFNSEGQLGFTGSWIVDIKMSNIVAKNSVEQIWDSEELVFTNKNYRVEVFEPPNLSLTQFTANRVDIGEGEAVTFTIVISNDGEAEATGNVEILQSGSVVGTTSFTAPGYDSIAVTYDWSVPGNYDGEVNLRAQINSNSVNPPGGPEDRVTDDFQTLTLNVEGTVNVKPPSESGAGTGALIVPLIVFVVLIAGLGGAYFMYRRSQPSAEETDSFGDVSSLPEQPMAPPQPELPPVAPPTPQPEQPPAVPPPQGTLLSITVPEGAQPGQQIQIKAPDGRVVAVTIPAGMQPGTQFQVKI
jgi:hypothetical protein